MTIKNFARSLVILVAGLLAPLGLAHADPNQGPGGPILVITNGNQNFGKFYAEILRTEGFNEFAVAEIGSVSAATLNNYDVVVLAKIAVNSTQASLLSDWVNAGGNLIAMDPAPQLAGLLGITQTVPTLSNGYLLIDRGNRIGNAAVPTTLQFHGTAQLSTLSGATSLATLYSTASSATAFPAVTLRTVGANGGQAAAFMFDLATSIVYTRQGNPAWASEERDGLTPVRSSDKFFGASASDPQSDWIDLNKVAIPQADELQRFFANLITEMNADRKGLPRFWYFPHGYRAVMIMSGDDHGYTYVQDGGHTLSRFNQFMAASPAGCSLEDWECVRATSYIFTESALTNEQAVALEAQGFEIGLHARHNINGNCANYTQSSLDAEYAFQSQEFFEKFTSLQPMATQRHHCIVWSDWASGAKVQLAYGSRMDTSYYFWPSSWVQDVPGHFTGSAMPMRFADLDGSLIDVYQTVTQMTDESGQSYPFTVDTLLDRAVGPDEQYGVYTVNAHLDNEFEDEATLSVTSALDRGVPVVSAKQMLRWLDARNASSFGSFNRTASTLSFNVSQHAAARGLQGMLPWRTANRYVTTLRRNGTDVPYEVMTVKGVEYAVFPALSGNYVADYLVDALAPQIVSRIPAPGATNVSVGVPIRIGFSEALDAGTVGAPTVELRDAGNALVPATITYLASSQAVRIAPSQALLNSSTYTISVRGGASDPRIKDLAGNALAATSTWSFTTSAAPQCPCTIFSPSETPQVLSENDAAGVELGVKFRSDVNGYVKGIRFYKGPNNTGTHTGTLWSVTGQPLATAVFMAETSGGWQEVLFPTPVQVTANTTYVASYHAPAGGYSVTGGQFLDAGVDNNVLHALSASEAGGNGVYSYGPGGQFPASTWEGSNYWVDVVFDTVGGAPVDVIAPSVTISTPVDAPTFEAEASPLALAGTAIDNFGVTQVTWTNDRGGSGTATGTGGWSIAGVPLSSGTNVITVTARDAAGNTGTDVLTVSYTPAPDATPPTVSGRTPSPGENEVALGASVAITFSEAMNPATINGSAIELRNASNALVASTVSYDPVTFTATVVPTSRLAVSTVYTVTVKGGAADPRVKDAAGNALATNVSWTFTTTAIDAISLWPNTAVPSVASEPDFAAVELGVKFRTDVAGYVTGLRFYKGPGNTGVHVGTLWSGSGQAIASATFIDETETGWQQVNFPSPVPIQANTLYVASYSAPNGGYAYDTNYFTTSGTSNGVLHAPSSASVDGNGVYAYGSGSAFPTESWAGSNYWVDVLFATSIGPDVTPPAVLSRAPANGAINVPTNSPVNVSFTEQMNPATITAANFELRNAANAVVAATVTYAGNTATLVPTSTLANSSNYTVRVRGGASGVKDVAGNALPADDTWSFATAAVGGPCAANAITAENCLSGNPASEWDINGVGDTSIQGFATQISVNRGSTIQFKVSTNATNYRLDIYRMGYYGGLGARRITTVNPSASLPQTQPACLTQASTGLIDCGNWAVSASWQVPATAVSGIYFAKVIRADTSGASHIFFIVRNDAAASDMVFQTSDTTWQAYNTWGGNSLYQGSPGTNPARAYKVSYNRPFNTRVVDNGQDWVFNAEYPMVRWLEANGYDVTYISGLDTHRSPNLITSRRVFLSVGHDEYWSGPQRANVEAARDAGVHLAFFSGNEVFWKTRWENSIDASNTPYRTLVAYKETHAGAKIDPSSEWTGTWRDPRFSPPSDGNRPENALTGTIFTVNTGTSSIQVPAEEGKMRFWRNTSVAALSPGQTATMPHGTLGYEWDSDLENGSRPAGLIRMSDTTVSGVEKLQDYGSAYAIDTANHALTMYKTASGARVFGAGTVQWSWGLDANHDRAGTPVDVRMQQATVNLFADMNAQPATLQPGLTTASPSTDNTPPTVTIQSPANAASFPQSSILISGTATDTGGGMVAGVEVSTDGGGTWQRANGRATWNYTWSPEVTGSVTVRVRAVDDSGNLQLSPATVTVTITSAPCPCSIWPSTSPTSGAEADPNSIEVGTRFRTSSNGSITALRFFKDPQNTGVHVGSLWTADGDLLAQVTFTNETASGWQVQALPVPVNVSPGQYYIVSYHAPSGYYIGDDHFFANNGVTSGPLHAPKDGIAGPNGVYKYSDSPTFPTETWLSENYWVDVVFSTSAAPADSVNPSVTITSPTSSSSTTVTATPLNIGGTASDNVGVTQVTWANNRGGSGTASGTNSWSVSGITLLSGSNVITVTARDAAGNTSTDTLTVTYSPDTTQPNVSITSPTSNSTLTTQTSPLSIGGTASDNIAVTEVTWSNNRGGSGTATGTTSWNATGIVLLSGSNILTVTARDAAGNTRTDTLTVTYSPDTTQPNVSITSPTSNSTMTTQVTPLSIGGTASDNVAVTEVTWTNNRGGSGTASGTTSWNVTGIPLLSGSNIITVTARDAAGNTRTDTLTVTYSADTTQPNVSITSPTSNSTMTTQATPLSIGGTASDNVGVTQVTWSNNRGGSGTASGTTSWNVTGIPLLSGSNIITVTARDAAGNTRTDTLTVTYNPDTTQPNVTITSPTSNSTLTTQATPLSIGGTASDNIGVTQVTWSNNRGGSGTASGTTSWNVTGIPLLSGSNIITVTARDAAGNTRTDTLTVTYNPDTTQPNVTITGPTSNSSITVTTTPLTLSGTASDNVGVTLVSWSSSRGSSGNANGTTSWSVPSITLLSGTNVLTVTARDAAGNTRTDTLTVTYNPDTTQPNVTITSPTSNSSHTATSSPMSIGGTASDNVGVTQVTWSNSRGGSGTASGTNNWSASGIALQSGSNVITVTARDAAGNIRTDTITVTFSDTTRPTVQITSPTTSSSLTTLSSSISLGGSASDNVGVTQVTWSNDRGGSGTASGTTSWNAGSVSLVRGSNVITVTARDAAGNTQTDTLTVNRLL